MARDDPRPRSLARGTVVQLRLRARLLGVKLLVVDGTVTLTPGEAVVLLPSREHGPVQLPKPPASDPIAMLEHEIAMLKAQNIRPTIRDG